MLKIHKYPQIIVQLQRICIKYIISSDLQLLKDN